MDDYCIAVPHTGPGGLAYTCQMVLARSHEFTLGAAEAASVHFFLKKVDDLFVVASSEVHIFEIFEAHTTLLVERTVLLY